MWKKCTILGGRSFSPGWREGATLKVIVVVVVECEGWFVDQMEWELRSQRHAHPSSESLRTGWVFPGMTLSVIYWSCVCGVI